MLIKNRLAHVVPLALGAAAVVTAAAYMLIASASDSLAQHTPSATPEAVLENLETYLNTHDVDGILSLFDEDGMVIFQPSGEGQTGLASVEAGFQGFLDLGGTADINVRRVYQVGDTALVLVDWTFSGTDSEGNDFAFGAAATDVLKQADDGAWYYLIDNAFGTTPAQ